MDSSEPETSLDYTAPKDVFKRSADPENSDNIKQGIQVSITANFQVLQQKLRRELMFRGYRVGSLKGENIDVSIYF